jgi:predicted RNase H-like nuclease (RuvC/YqgF family)
METTLMSQITQDTDDDTEIEINYAQQPDQARQLAELQRRLEAAEERAAQADERAAAIEQRAEQADALAKRALDLVNEKDERIETLEADLDDLRERLATLEGRVTPDPTTKAYNEKTRDERVREIRLTVARKATQTGGKASMDYNGVLMLFNGHPSPGYAYKLLDLAANMDGFTYEKREGTNDRLCVDMAAVSDESVFHAVNKDEPSEGR